MGGPAAVVLDLDGVLIESEQVWDAAREDLVRERGGTWDERATTDMMGMSSKEWSSYMHDRLSVPMTPAEINDDVVRRVAAAYEEHLPLLPHAVETVRELGGRWRLGVASSSNRPIIELVLDRSELTECVAVEDSSNGIKAAIAAGMRTIAVPNRQFRPDDDVLATATAVVPSLD